jgi:hypothetical protein
VGDGLHAQNVTEGEQCRDCDFVIISASREWSLRPVLMVRRYVPNPLSVRAVEGGRRLKESVGLTTSPEG